MWDSGPSEEEQAATRKKKAKLRKAWEDFYPLREWNGSAFNRDMLIRKKVNAMKDPKNK